MNGYKHPRGLELPVTDIAVGQLVDAELQCQVSVRGGRTVVLAFAKGDRGIEIAFSPKAARQMAEIVEAAAKVAEGK